MPGFREILDAARSHLVVLVLIATGILGWRLWSKKYPWRRTPWAPRLPFSAHIYRQMLMRLESQGFIKSKSETHLEFLNALTGLPPEKREAVESITRFYERHRFGNLPFSAGEQYRIQSLIRQI